MNENDSGSIIPIGIGVITLSAIFALVMVELIGVQYQTLQNKQLSDLLVLKVATDLNHDQIPPVINLDYRPVVADLLKEASKTLGVEPTEFSVSSPDGKTMTSTVCTNWKSITGLTFGALGKVCAQSKARAIA